jgi:hypothetical protein
VVQPLREAYDRLPTGVIPLLVFDLSPHILSLRLLPPSMATPSTSIPLGATSVTSTGALWGASPVSGNISPEPTPDELADARLIDLTRAAGSPEATSLAEAVTAAMVPHLNRKRPLGPEGRRRGRCSRVAAHGVPRPDRVHFPS